MKLDLKQPTPKVSKRYLNISQSISDLKFRSEKDYFRSDLNRLLVWVWCKNCYVFFLHFAVLNSMNKYLKHCISENRPKISRYCGNLEFIVEFIYQ